MSQTNKKINIVHNLLMPADRVRLEGELIIPEDAMGIVLFAHGSGSSRHSSRNQYVTQTLQAAGMGTLLFDLLTAQEEDEEQYTHHLRFDIGLLSRRLVSVAHWVKSQEKLSSLPVGFFGASTGAAAALVALAEMPEDITAVVSRSGRVDLAESVFTRIKAPILLIVGGHDELVIKLNRDAYSRLQCEKQLKIIEGATHLFQEPGTLEETVALATAWFTNHFKQDKKVLT